MVDLAKGGPLQRYGGSGVGIHGGDSGLGNPFVVLQALVRTHGCLRVHNAHLEAIVDRIEKAKKAEGKVLLTVAE